MRKPSAETVRHAILHETAALPEGRIVSARALLHLGSRAAVDQALSRLARAGRLLRVGRGLYVRPVEARFGVRPPSPEKVATSIGDLTGETVVPHGAAAANSLGLTTQVPVRSVFLTSGRTRSLRVGRQMLELKHAPAWQLRQPGRKSGDAVRALAWLGPEHAREAVEELNNRLPQPEKEALLAVRASLPTWLSQAVSHSIGFEHSRG